MAGFNDFLAGLSNFGGGITDVLKKPGVGEGLTRFGLSLLAQDTRMPLGMAVGRAGIEGLQGYQQGVDQVQEQASREQAAQDRQLEIQIRRRTLEKYNDEESSRTAYKNALKNALGQIKEGKYTDLKSALLAQEDLPAEQLVSLMKAEKPTKYSPFRQTVGNKIVSGFYNPENPTEQVGVVEADRYKPMMARASGGGSRGGRGGSADGAQGKSFSNALRALQAGELSYNRSYPLNKELGMRVDPETGDQAPSKADYMRSYLKSLGMSENLVPAQGTPKAANMDAEAGTTTMPVDPQKPQPIVGGLSDIQTQMIKAIDSDLKAGKIDGARAMDLLRKFGIDPAKAKAILGQ
jgi:hypothetical protein